VASARVRKLSRDLHRRAVQHARVRSRVRTPEAAALLALPFVGQIFTAQVIYDRSGNTLVSASSVTGETTKI